MINSKDLRIGNLIYAYKAKVISKIENIYGPSELVDIVDNTEYRSHRMSLALTIKPIELTEEILLKAGFEINTSSFLWVKEMKLFKGQMAFSKDLKKTMIFNSFINQSVNINQIKYVHSLQNIFYSLTGEELNIQL